MKNNDTKTDDRERAAEQKQETKERIKRKRLLALRSQLRAGAAACEPPCGTGCVLNHNQTARRTRKP